MVHTSAAATKLPAVAWPDPRPTTAETVLAGHGHACSADSVIFRARAVPLPGAFFPPCSGSGSCLGTQCMDDKRMDGRAKTAPAEMEIQQLERRARRCVLAQCKTVGDAYALRSYSQSSRFRSQFVCLCEWHGGGGGTDAGTRMSCSP